MAGLEENLALFENMVKFCISNNMHYKPSEV